MKTKCIAVVASIGFVACHRNVETACEPIESSEIPHISATKDFRGSTSRKAIWDLLELAPTRELLSATATAIEFHYAKFRNQEIFPGPIFEDKDNGLVYLTFPRIREGTVLPSGVRPFIKDATTIYVYDPSVKGIVGYFSVSMG